MFTTGNNTSTLLKAVVVFKTSWLACTIYSEVFNFFKLKRQTPYILN